MVQRKKMSNRYLSLFLRYPNNPILTISNWPYPANSVFNAGVTMLPNGETLLLVRVEDRRGISHLTVARSTDGISHWRIDPTPTFSPDPERYPEELWGIEDPYWGDHQLLIEARKDAWWDANKIGLSPPPLETPEGWLILYHGVRQTASGCIYRQGMALLDLEDPRLVLRRSDEWIFGPAEEYEREGDVDDEVIDIYRRAFNPGSQG